MLDWERHEDELANARIAEDAMRSGRRTRHRRLAVTATVGAVLAVLAVLVPLTWPAPAPTVVTGAGSPAVPPARSSTTSSHRATPPDRAPASTDQVQLYLLVLSRPRLGAARTLVPDRLCVGASTRPVLPCRGPAIPATVQDAVERAMPSVRFVASPAWPQRLGQPTVVGFGTLVVRGDRASLETQSMCGSLCGSGERSRFVRHDGRWTATADGVRGGWIS